MILSPIGCRTRMPYPVAERVQSLFREDVLNLTSELRFRLDRLYLGHIEQSLAGRLDRWQQERQKTRHQAVRALFPTAIETDPGSTAEADDTARAPLPGTMRPAITEDGDATTVATAFSPRHTGTSR